MTKISWADKSWNPVVGCSKCSPGCKNCYAEQWAVRLAHMPHTGEKYSKVIGDNMMGDYFWNGKVFCDESALDKPLHWRDPRRIFVVSMGDLFLAPFEFIDKVMAVGALCPQHILLILTKRVNKMLKYFNRPDFWTCILPNAISLPLWFNKGVQEPLPGYIDFNAVSKTIHGPLPNLHLGVSISTPDEKWKITELCRIPAAHRFVSFEPLLADMGEILLTSNREDDTDLEEFGQHIDGVIIGAESKGGNAGRPCKMEWVRDLVGQCDAAGVKKVHIKQLHIDGKLEKNVKQFPPDLRRQEKL